MGGPEYNSSQETTADMLAAIRENMPGLVEAMGSSILPMENAQLSAQESLAPRQNQLALDLARQFYPGFTQLGIEQGRQQALGQANTDLDVLNGPGQELARSAMRVQREADPEYYAAREQTLDAMSKLFGSQDDPNGGLNEAESEGVRRSLARDNASMGNTGPTKEGTVEAAMNFGSAGAARKQQKQAALSNAIQTAAGATPGLKSGVDTFQLTTGRPSNNSGLGQFGGVGQVGQNTMALGQGLMQQAGTFAGNNQTALANKKDAYDKVSQIMGSLPSISCCWVFAEFYGSRIAIPWYTRAARDAFATAENREGYRRFAKVVVPLMQKSRLWRKLIEITLIRPLNAHAAHLAGLNRLGVVLWPVHHAWFGFFRALGVSAGEPVEVFG